MRRRRSDTKSTLLKDCCFPSDQLISLVDEFIDSDYPDSKNYQFIMNLLGDNVKAIEKAMDQLVGIYQEVKGMQQVMTERIELHADEHRRFEQQLRDKRTKAEEEVLISDFDLVVEI